MDEGKPTKAKWWSRPRPHDAGPAATTDHHPEPSPSDAVPAPTAPDASLSGDTAPTGPDDVRAAEAAGDAVPPGLGAGSAVPAAAAGSAAPGPVGDSAAPGPVAGSAAPGPVADGALAGPASDDRVPDAVGGVPAQPGAPGVAAAGRDDAPVDTADDYELDRPRPLHDPDPYSTPPYGRPGPWAPAPPVQHPVATPAHGTRFPAAAPVPQGTPAQGVPAQAGAPAPGARVPAETPAPGPQVPAGTPAHGTHLPAGAPVPHGAQGPSAQPAPPMAPYAGGGPQDAAQPGQAAAPHVPWQNYDPWAAAGALQQNGAAVATVTQRRRRVRKVLVVAAVAIALASGGVGGAVGAYLERNGGLGGVELPQASKEAPGRAPDSVAGIAARALPSVVTLHVRGSDEEGTGTGFVLDGQGHILTNNHVIEPAGSSGEISVTFSGGESAEAEVVGHDSGYDLAVVKVSGVSGLDPMPLGNSDNVQVGDPVVAIGAPFDLANTVTSGIISAKERPITAGGEKGDGSDVSYVNALQTDAPINPGNSGGPLLDSKARVIGINSAIRSADSGSDLEGGQAGSIGLGFAIPINQGKRVAEELINTGKATHPVIGVTLDMNYTGDGARVGTKGNGGGPPVTAGGPGAKAGIEPGDVITEVDGRRVHSGEELIVKTRAHRPGDRLQLTLRRDGTEKKVTLVLGSADGD
ncbi:trypsin-like peptidase domain-containing protein [Streptomyces sp. NPDC005813]|uniref:S1C family serine protease n=1 Tax=Streptomyces sp. NPDC005813 TaxID=3155592 RepID=UPI0033F3E48C